MIVRTGCLCHTWIQGAFTLTPTTITIKYSSVNWLQLTELYFIAIGLSVNAPLDSQQCDRVITDVEKDRQDLLVFIVSLYHRYILLLTLD